MVANTNTIPASRVVSYFLRTGCISQSSRYRATIDFINSRKTRRASRCCSINVRHFFDDTISCSAWGYQERQYKLVRFNDNQRDNNFHGYHHHCGSAQIANNCLGPLTANIPNRLRRFFSCKKTNDSKITKQNSIANFRKALEILRLINW